MNTEEQLRKGRIEWIECLGLPVERSTSMLSIKVEGRRIDFWPGSNTYYLHSKQKYGIGIPELCQKIKTHLEKKNG